MNWELHQKYLQKSSTLSSLLKAEAKTSTSKIEQNKQLTSYEKVGNCGERFSKKNVNIYINAE